MPIIADSSRRIYAHGIVDTRDLDENTTIDLDAEGNVLALTLEHASRRTDVSQLVLEGIAA